MLAPSDFLDLDHCEHSDLFVDGEPVWTALSRIGDYLSEKVAALKGPRINSAVDDRAVIGPRVYIGHDVKVEANAVIQGPAWIGDGCTVRSGAYVRSNVIAGRGVMLGNSSEFKNCLLFDAVETPHFNYVGDSILGYKAHLGAGVILSNVRLDRANIIVRAAGGEQHDTGLRKFGAIIGDRTEIGCNSVVSPGSMLGRDCVIYPCTHWQGPLSDRRIVKNRQRLDVVERSD